MVVSLLSFTRAGFERHFSRRAAPHCVCRKRKQAAEAAALAKQKNKKKGKGKKPDQDLTESEDQGDEERLVGSSRTKNRDPDDSVTDEDEGTYRDDGYDDDKPRKKSNSKYDDY